MSNDGKENDDVEPEEEITEETVPSTEVEDDDIESDDDEKEEPVQRASHNRRVHFTHEEKAHETFFFTNGPLESHPLVPLSVTLQRYRSACQRLQTRPISSIIDQLSTMDDGRNSYADRLTYFRIVNSKLDSKQIEAIEEIFSCCRFHTIDFTGTTIDENGAFLLFDILEYYESCIHLDLSNNHSFLSYNSPVLSKFLRRSHSIERLDFNSTRFDENLILNLIRSVRLSSSLYELHLESCQLNGRLLSRFVHNSRSWQTVRELFLCDNRIQVNDAATINELIRTSGRFLFVLDLRSNSIQDEGLGLISSQFSQYDETLKKTNCLFKINLQSNQITAKGTIFLAKALIHNRTLRSINLSYNNITNEGLFVLRDALLTNRTINELLLRNCQLTDQAAIALAEFIAESSTIHHIDLRGNSFQASGICGMAIAIKGNKSLFQLDFDPIVIPSVYANNSMNQNLNRPTASQSVFSLSNLRQMTTVFSDLTFSSIVDSNRNIGGGGTRELLEQKAKWLNDIAAICKRNFSLYEENQLNAELSIGQSDKNDQDPNEKNFRQTSSNFDQNEKNEAEEKKQVQTDEVNSTSSENEKDVDSLDEENNVDQISSNLVENAKIDEKEKENFNENFSTPIESEKIVKVSTEENQIENEENVEIENALKRSDSLRLARNKNKTRNKTDEDQNSIDSLSLENEN